MQLKKIRVYGRLRKFLGSSYFEAAVSSPAEAVRFLLCNFPKVEKHMSDQYYKIKMNNLDVELENLNMKGYGEIQIIPIATGSAFVAAIIGGIASAGAAVISTAAAVATSVGGAAVAAISTVAAIPVVGSIATAVLTNAAISGITSLLAPTPAVIEGPSSVGDTDPQIAGSYSFSGIQNVSRSGISVPIIYGEVFTGSIVISSGIDTVEVEGTAA